ESSIFLATCIPDGLVSTMRPFPPLTVSTSPFGAMIRPSGVLSAPPDVIFVPVPALLGRRTAPGIALMALARLLAPYSLPVGAGPRPVGPITIAAGSVRCGKPEPILVILRSRGGIAPPTTRFRRRIVPLCTTMPPAAFVPFSTLLTNGSVSGPLLAAAMSQGPLMPSPENGSRTWPRVSRTIRQPADEVAAEPSSVGRLPTTTQPPRRISSAVVRPTPPGQRPGSLDAMILANTLSFPDGETWTIVVPVPCRFLALLKLLIRTLPLTSERWLWGTRAVPYGLTSPLAGTVEPIVVSLWNLPMKDPGVPACAVGATASTAVAAAPAKAVPAQAIRCVIDTGHSPFQGRFPPGTEANGPESRRMTSRAHQLGPPTRTMPLPPLSTDARGIGFNSGWPKFLRAGRAPGTGRYAARSGPCRVKMDTGQDGNQVRT